MLSVFVLFLLGVIGVLIYLLLGRSGWAEKTKDVSNFDECVAAGYLVTLSYPGNCVTPDGKSFTQIISDEAPGQTPIETPVDRSDVDRVVPGDSGGVACTMDAKECPDGSYVGRSGPDCEFTPCPKR